MTKPRVCVIIFPASERGLLCSNRILRGIAQLVEQRSPNGNRNLISRMITGFLRLETSVSSLFSCFAFCKSIQVDKDIYAKSRAKPSKDFRTASKDQQFFIRVKMGGFSFLKTTTDTFLSSLTQFSNLSLLSITNLFLPQS